MPVKGGKTDRPSVPTLVRTALAAALLAACRLPVPADPFALLDAPARVTARVAGRPEVQASVELQPTWRCGGTAGRTGRPGHPGPSGRPGRDGPPLDARPADVRRLFADEISRGLAIQVD